MRIFITGGTGFIGTHLVRKLQKDGHELLLLLLPSEKEPLSKKINTVKGTLSDTNKWKQLVNDFKPDTTIHMAWESIPSYDSKTSIKNLNYGLDLIYMLAEIGCKRVILTGSCWEYGQKNGQLKEDSQLKQFTPFSAAKNSLNWLGSEIAKENNMQFIWTRFFYVYGPGQKPTSLIPHIINSIKNNKNPNIKTPKTKNDFIYVEDIADALSMIVEKCNKSAVYNIGSGKSTSVEEVMGIVYDQFGKKPDLEDKSFKSENIPSDNFWADISKIKEDIGWKPKTSLLDGIKKTIQG